MPFSSSLNTNEIYSFQPKMIVQFEQFIFSCLQNHVMFNVRFHLDNGFTGEVTEWLKVLAWNAGVVKATEGSNPSLTAN